MVQKTTFTKADLQEALAKLPRTRLAYTPTPLEDMPRFSEALGGPRILIKRDDLTGLAFGGNKARHMEFRIADAIDKGCDSFIYSFVSTSNYARMISASCVKVGMKSIFVVRGGKGKTFQGSLLIQNIQGTEFHFLEEDSREDSSTYCTRLGEQLKAEGHVPYVSNEEPIGWYAGTLGYLDCATELADQMEEMSITDTYIYLVAGNSMGGLTLASKLLGLPWKVVGISAGDRPDIYGSILNVSAGVKDLLGLPYSLQREDFEVDEGFVGEGYALPTEKGVEAIRLAASTDAILLDPNYTGKAMSGLIDHIRQGRLGPKDTVVFIHTGGLPVLFEEQYREPLTTWGV